MKRARRGSQSQEPMGIVISRGSRDEATPAFWAYVYGPAPEDTAEEAESRVAA